MKALVFSSLFFGILLCAQGGAANDRISPNESSEIFSEFRVGYMKHDVALRSNSREEGQDTNLEVLFLSPRLLNLIGSPHPTLGGALNNQSDTSHVYAGLTWQWRPLRKTFFNLGLGGTVHDAELRSNDPETKRFGTRALFRYALTAGYQFSKYYNISLMFDHSSNANTAYPNNSLEKFGLQIGFVY